MQGSHRFGCRLAERGLAIAVLSSSPVLTHGISHLLEQRSEGIICHSPDHAQAYALLPGFAVDALLLAPQNWQEMAGWLPTARQRYTGLPWVLYTDPRIAGAFGSLLDSQPCALVPWMAEPDQLRETVHTVASRRMLHLKTALMALYDRGAFPLPDGRRPQEPSEMELQCGCAVSLGMGNRQIADLLCVGEATVKSHLYRLMQKLGIDNRQSLGAYIQQALAPSTSALIRA